MSKKEREEVLEVEDDLEGDGKEQASTEAAPDTLRILEALLFASDELLNISRIKAILPGNPDAKQIRKFVDKINMQLQKERHPFEVVEIGGGFQFRTVAYYHPWVRQIFKEKAAKKLSIQALECLAIIAYKQPISKAEIEAIRGVVSDGAMKTLLEKKLVTISGRSDKPGRPLQYSTTSEFIRYFGLNKIEDLPRIEEFEAIAREKIDDLSIEELANGEIDSDNQQENSEEVQLVESGEASASEQAIAQENQVQQQDSAFTDSSLSSAEPTALFAIDGGDIEPVNSESDPPPPEPTALFEVNEFSDSEKMPETTLTDISGFEPAAYLTEIDQLQSEELEQTIQESSSVQEYVASIDDVEKETSQLSGTNRDTILKNGKSVPDGEQQYYETAEYDSATIDPSSTSDTAEEVFELKIPERKVENEEDDEENLNLKKGFFSKMRKKKNEQLDE